MNVILLISDTYRYDNLFDRASMPVRTPNLDAFAARAVSLSRLYAASFPTIPQRTDLTSGRCGWPWYGWQSRLHSSTNHLPELLGRAGYPSQLLCDCPHLFRADFDDGFSAACQTRGQEGDVHLLHLNDPVRRAMDPRKTRTAGAGSRRTLGAESLVDVSHWINEAWQVEEDRFAPHTARRAIRWLERNYRHHPFFLWVDFFDPHEPWDPPEYMVRRYDPDYDGPPMYHPNYGRADDYTPAERTNLRAHYCAEAEMVDRWVGRVIDKIEELGLLDNSIVVFTTDHGFSIGEHNRTGKSNINPGDDRAWPIYPEVAHIPLLISAPGLTGGREVDAILQPPDILPTLLELAGVTVAPPEPFHGKSFAPLLRGDSEAPLHELAITASFLRRDPARPSFAKATTPMVYTTQWACAPIGSEGPSELYDLRTDPECTTDLADRHPDLVKELRAAAVGWLHDLNAPAGSIEPFGGG